MYRKTRIAIGVVKVKTFAVVLSEQCTLAAQGEGERARVCMYVGEGGGRGGGQAQRSSARLTAW